MSFGANPLGQGRRLDHNTVTFLGKPLSNGAKPNPQRIPPISYAYGAPALNIQWVLDHRQKLHPRVNASNPIAVTTITRIYIPKSGHT
ncbi:hypothetical protein BDP27DRAFT_742626 [Rhodocollybia butyracea]|uniref:Uncharacterized protein n=1 Tax=Rhodocollybia butyracea TaxID=206335 RepID=A0A9P5TWT2_9AGAR|nr:hypothetical protein BDP27DRAFT_742626 [Rhodocollybia butyracea]